MALVLWKVQQLTSNIPANCHETDQMWHVKQIITFAVDVHDLQEMFRCWWPADLNSLLTRNIKTGNFPASWRENGFRLNVTRCVFADCLLPFVHYWWRGVKFMFPCKIAVCFLWLLWLHSVPVLKNCGHYKCYTWLCLFLIAASFSLTLRSVLTARLSCWSSGEHYRLK